jgi:hypothetical protein
MKKTSSTSKVNDPRMFEEENAMDSELGEMGDSNDKGVEADIHNEVVSLREVLESSNEPIGDDADNIDDLKGEEFSPAEGNGVVQLVGAPDGWVPPGPPPTWAGYQPKGNAPELGNVDNPGSWSLFSFCPKYKTGSVYSGHFTPAGAMVLPVNEHGERELNGWRFHYQGWTPDVFDKSTYVRGEATQQDLKPDSWKGSLDANILRKHGCDADRVRATLSSSTNSCSHSVHRRAQELRMTVECHIIPMLQYSPISMLQSQEVALGWATTGAMSRFLNWYIGLVFPFGMGHWMENQVQPFHVGINVILAMTAPLLMS